MWKERSDVMARGVSFTLSSHADHVIPVTSRMLCDGPFGGDAFRVLDGEGLSCDVGR